MVHHLTSKYFVLKDKIQALVDAGVLTLKSEQKKVTANMVTLNFRTFPKVTIPDGLAPFLKARLAVINSLAEQQEAKGFVPMTTKAGEIMWVYPDIDKDENGNPTSPSSRAGHAMSSPLQTMTSL